MGYVWTNYSSENNFILSTENIVQGMETSKVIGSAIPVNVLVRLLSLVFPPSVIDTEEKLIRAAEAYSQNDEYKSVFNILMHFQADIDRHSGFLVQDIIAMNIENEIYNNHFGTRILNEYDEITDDVKYHLLNNYSHYLMSGCCQCMLEQFLITIYGRINKYYQNSTDTLYLYIHEERTDMNEKILDLAKFFLYPINVKVEVMWKNEHIPIIDTDYSMIIDNMCIGK